MLGSLHHLHRRAGIHDALEVADADVGHAGHVVVEAQHHHTLGTVLWIYDGIHTLHVILIIVNTTAFIGVILVVHTRGQREAAYQHHG